MAFVPSLIDRGSTWADLSRPTATAIVQSIVLELEKLPLGACGEPYQAATEPQDLFRGIRKVPGTMMRSSAPDSPSDEIDFYPTTGGII